jgi:hypothetical protein
VLRSLRTFRWREAVPRMIADFLIVHFSMIAALAMSVVYQTGLGNAVAAHAIVSGFLQDIDHSAWGDAGGDHLFCRQLPVLSK